MASGSSEPSSVPPAPELIARRLVDFVERSGPTLGARLGLLANTLFPGFSPRQYACRNLRAFIERHAPELRIVSTTGPDPVYGSASGGATPARTEPTTGDNA